MLTTFMLKPNTPLVPHLSKFLTCDMLWLSVCLCITSRYSVGTTKRPHAN